jgi:hypothetical protein
MESPFDLIVLLFDEIEHDLTNLALAQMQLEIYRMQELVWHEQTLQLADNC